MQGSRRRHGLPSRELLLPWAYPLISSHSADAWKMAEPLDGPTMAKYTALAKEFDVWLSLGGFQEKAEEAKKMHSTAELSEARHTRGR